MYKRFYLEVDGYCKFILVAKDEKIGIRHDSSGYINRYDIDGELTLSDTERTLKLYPKAEKISKKGLYEITDKETLEILFEKLYLRRKVLLDLLNASESVLNNLPIELRRKLYSFDISMDNNYDLAANIEWDDGDKDYII